MSEKVRLQLLSPPTLSSRNLHYDSAAAVVAAVVVQGEVSSLQQQQRGGFFWKPLERSFAPRPSPSFSLWPL